MLKLMMECTDCGYEADVIDIANLDGCCPKCHGHAGNVIYGSRLDAKAFLTELYTMSEKDIAKYADAIKICAEDIVENDLF